MTPTSWRLSALASCKRDSSSPVQRFRRLAERLFKPIANRITHARHGEQIERLLNTPPIILGHKHRAASLAGDVNWHMASRRVVNELVELRSGLCYRNRSHVENRTLNRTCVKRSFLAVRGLPCRTPDTAWKLEVFSALAVVSRSGFFNHGFHGWHGCARTFNRTGPDTAAELASSSPEPWTIAAALATLLDSADAEPTALPAVACSSPANFWFRNNIGQFVEVADSISARFALRIFEPQISQMAQIDPSSGNLRKST